MDYSDPYSTKAGTGGVWPQNAGESQWQSVEPLLTPEQIQNRHLFGIPLVSGMKNPVNGLRQIMTPELVKDFIDRAIPQVELDLGIDIFPNVIEEKHPFDQVEYTQGFGFFRTEHRPISRVHKISVSPSTNTDVFIVPMDWIETGYLPSGQINILPMNAALGQGGFIPAMSAGGAVFLQILGNRSWLPSFWKIEYTSGFMDGKMPKIINDYLGVVAAMDILGALAATYGKSQSHSLGIDGLSQSVSTPGPQIFAQRMGELEKKRDTLRKRLKTVFAQKLITSNI